MPIYEHQQGSYQFNWSVRNILQNCENICKGAVDYDYIEKKIESCDFLYVNYEPVEVKLIGFAIVFDYGDELYIDVICNLPKNNNKSFSNSIYNLFFSQYGGKDIINKIKDKAIAMGKKHVGLKALRPVISYYSHLGFTFPYSGHPGRRIEKIQEFKELMDKYKDLEEKRNKIFEKEEDDNDYERTPEEKQIFKEFNRISNMINGKLWDFYKRYQPGRYKEPDLRTSLEETDSFSKRIQKIQKVVDLGTNGIKMIFNLSQKKTRSSLLRKTRRRNSSMPSNNNDRSRSNGSRSNGSRGSRSRGSRSDRSRSSR
jgi:hypothetical protein